MQTIIWVFTFIALFLFFLYANEKEKNKNKIDPNKLTALKPEFNTEMRQIISELEKYYFRLEEIKEEGEKIYEALPTNLQSSNKYSQLDSSNMSIDLAAMDIRSAIGNIKDALV